MGVWRDGSGGVIFRGRYEHSIDTKGRLSVPSRFREVLAAGGDERLVVTNMDGALWAYSMAEWQKVEEKVASLPQLKPEVKLLQRFFISAATECPLDPTGRILLPPTLRDYAALKKDVVLLGVTRRIEIWSRERWQKFSGEAEAALGDVADQFSDLGI